jgi:hypothetical protein
MKKLLFLLMVTLLLSGGCSKGRVTGSVGVGGYYGYGQPVYQQPYYGAYQQPYYGGNSYSPVGVPCCTFPLMGYGPGYFTPGPGNTYSPYNFTPIAPGNIYGVPQGSGMGVQGNIVVPANRGHIIHRRDRIR